MTSSPRAADVRRVGGGGARFAKNNDAGRAPSLVDARASPAKTKPLGDTYRRTILG